MKLIRCLLLPSLFVFAVQVYGQQIKIVSENIAVTAQAPKDSMLVRMILPYKDSMEQAMKKVVGFCLQGMFKKQPESSIGNFLTDAMRWAAKQQFNDTTVDLAIMNYGGIRSSFAKGDVTLKQIFEVMPFDNMLVLQNVSGAVLMQLINKASEKGGWPVSGISVKFKNKVCSELLVKGKPIDSTANYVIAISDYLANGGDDCKFLKGISYKNIGLTIRDAIITYTKWLTKQGKPIDTKVEKRFVYELE